MAMGISGDELTADYNCYFTVVVDDVHISYHIDNIIAVDTETLVGGVEKDGLIFNADFEVATEHTLFNINGWQVSNGEIESVYNTLSESKSQNALAHLRLFNRQENFKLNQKLCLDSLDFGGIVEVSYWAKFVDSSGLARANPDDDNWHKISMSLTASVVYTDGTSENLNILCNSGCVVPDGKWHKYGNRCSLESLLVENIAEVTSVDANVKMPNANDLEVFNDNF